MSGNRDEAAVWEVVTEWMTSANADKRAIAVCLAVDPPLVDVVAFHCQQAAEKLLKGFLVLAGSGSARAMTWRSWERMSGGTFPP